VNGKKGTGYYQKERGERTKGAIGALCFSEEKGGEEKKKKLQSKGNQRLGRLIKKKGGKPHLLSGERKKGGPRRKGARPFIRGGGFQKGGKVSERGFGGTESPRRIAYRGGSLFSCRKQRSKF